MSATAAPSMQSSRLTASKMQPLIGLRLLCAAPTRRVPISHRKVEGCLRFHTDCQQIFPMTTKC
jgi:hypothetical protein